MIFFFSLDIEGGEFQVLQTIPWEKVKGKVFLLQRSRKTTYNYELYTPKIYHKMFLKKMFLVSKQKFKFLSFYSLQKKTSFKINVRFFCKAASEVSTFPTLFFYLGFTRYCKINPNQPSSITFFFKMTRRRPNFYNLNYFKNKGSTKNRLHI